jgi:hypothetical protein
MPHYPYLWADLGVSERQINLPMFMEMDLLKLWPTLGKISELDE